MPAPVHPPQTRATKMAAQRLALRGQVFPGVGESMVWNRKKETGFVIVPRTLPLIIQILDYLTKNTPVGSTYLDLWSRVYDEGYVKLDKPEEQALASGFHTKRGPSIWASRLDLLQKEGFILLAPGAHGPRSYALILNPYLVIHTRRKETKDIDDQLFNTLMAQALAIGSKAGIEPPAPPVPTATPPTPSAPRQRPPSRPVPITARPRRHIVQPAGGKTK